MTRESVKERDDYADIISEVHIRSRYSSNEKDQMPWMRNEEKGFRDIDFDEENMKLIDCERFNN